MQIKVSTSLLILSGFAFSGDDGEMVMKTAVAKSRCGGDDVRMKSHGCIYNIERPPIFKALKREDSVIHGFTPVGRANHYMPSLKAGSIVKVDRFEVSRCSSMYKITDHPFLIRFISLTIIDEVITGAPEINLQSRLDYVVWQIRYVQGSGLTKETTRVVIRLLIDP
ncbi:hypothetical protein DY000_02009896 [Brassica cretica]|uniref:DUF223 domain-containing protein n=1 Tax=Brassica cretica TaxID=69181 RepID=A0ABQ7C9U8_BRACR|nr:hypothetical protein DY000_02009896 [Brassica cretica]